MTRTGRPRSFSEPAVVEAATEVFWERGYAGTSVQRLGERAGVLPGSLHAAFGDKRALFLRALGHYAQGQREAAAWLREPGPVLPRLREMMYGIAAAAGTAQPRGCMLGNTAIEAAGDEETAGMVREAFSELEAALAEALARGRSDGEVRHEVEPLPQARALLATMQGLHVLARVETDPGRLREAVDATLGPLAETAPEDPRTA
ncbi:MAG: TetR/AcrR family transcriptional regulator [Actinobacteria bacterium]|nr:TetR/AcrR family transcriptional regulator [Actinomycetota bacterium]